MNTKSDPVPYYILTITVNSDSYRSKHDDFKSAEKRLLRFLEVFHTRLLIENYKIEGVFTHGDDERTEIITKAHGKLETPFTSEGTFVIRRYSE